MAGLPLFLRRRHALKTEWYGCYISVSLVQIIAVLPACVGRKKIIMDTLCTTREGKKAR